MSISMIIIAAPSGAGKSSFLEKTLKDFSEQLVDTVTYTTREMRQKEREGFPYHFVNQEKFKQLISEDYFVEWANVHSNLYGTPKHQIDDIIALGKTAIMDVDVQGAETFKAKYPDALSIFILPPSIEELLKRIAHRDDKLPEDLDIRLKNAKKEMTLADQFDHQIINDDFDVAYGQLKKVIEKSLGRG